MLKIELSRWGTANLVENESELPMYSKIQNLYLDFETTSGDDDLDSLNPWHHCDILGVCFLADTSRDAYYIPVRHRGVQKYKNIAVDAVHKWLKDILAVSSVWINHNIKYDYHVLRNSANIIANIPMVDTITKAKIAPFSFRFTYNLTDLTREWNYENIEPYEIKIKKYVKKDYGVIPIDLITEYGCVDVFATRKLNDTLNTLIPADCSRIVDLENDLTSILADIEAGGLHVDTQTLEIDNICNIGMLQILREQLEKATGIPGFRPHATSDCYKFFISDRGLEPKAWTYDKKTGAKRTPSFSKEALLLYKREVESDILDKIMYYKDLYKLQTSYTAPYRELVVNNRLYGTYNQSVSTGRMSMSKPSFQTMPAKAKEYITPEKGSILYNFDYSQIEFRVIAHYIRDPACIKAYNTDPTTDYHAWVAKMCDIDRKPAKTVNFLLGYGGGKKRCTNELMSNEVLIEQYPDLDALERVSNSIYDKYHETLPTLKVTMQMAANAVKTRGFVRTALGRRRYIDNAFSYKAFNTVCQGTAADFMKAATVRLYYFMKREMPYANIRAIVHDSWLIESDRELDCEPICRILSEMPEGVSLLVPIYVSYNSSTKNWRECS